MPRFFFHVHDGVALADTDGCWLPDQRAARKEAVQRAGAFLLKNPDQFWNGEDWSIEVRDEHDQILFTLHFVATVSPAGEKS